MANKGFIHLINGIPVISKEPEKPTVVRIETYDDNNKKQVEILEIPKNGTVTTKGRICREY